VLPELGLLLTQQHAQLVLMVQHLLLVQSFPLTVVTATKKLLDVSLALPLLLVNAQSVMPDTT